MSAPTIPIAQPYPHGSLPGHALYRLHFDAEETARKLLDEILRLAPDGRDYEDNQSLERARAEHRVRVEKADSLVRDLHAITEGLARQKETRW